MNEMKFIDKEHEMFWNEKYKEMMELGKTDVYLPKGGVLWLRFTVLRRTR